MGAVLNGVAERGDHQSCTPSMKTDRWEMPIMKSRLEKVCDEGNRKVALRRWLNKNANDW